MATEFDEYTWPEMNEKIRLRRALGRARDPASTTVSVPFLARRVDEIAGTSPLTRGAAETLSLLLLQGGIGNHGITRLLQRQTPGPVVGDPIVIEGDAERAHRLAPVEQHLCERAGEMATLWLAVTQGALNSAPEPAVDDPTAQLNFWVALGGNMMWAATSLMPEWAPIMIPMSFGGAAIGSGGAARDLASQPASPREALDIEIVAARDRFATSIREQAYEMAATMEEQGVTDPEQQDRELWRILFGAVPYEDGSALRKAASDALREALTAYVMYYDEWDKETRAEASARIDAVAGLSPPPSRDTPPLGKGMAVDATLADVRRERPFDAGSVVFHFTGPSQLDTTPASRKNRSD